MDRALVFVGERPQTRDVLRTGRSVLIGQGFANQAMFGTTVAVEGLACTPTSPTADLNIHVGVGSIYVMGVTDAVAYADLGTDASPLVKQGLLVDPVAFAITPPAVAGQSQVFLVEAALIEIDDSARVVRYYNGASPPNPFNGVGNNGVAQVTARRSNCDIRLKAGTAATTGTQTTPAADSGYVGLWAVTVAQGATQITTLNIALLPTAPYFPNLPGVPPALQQSTWSYAVDTGTVNALKATIYPPVTALVAGLLVQIKAANTVNGPATFQLNGLTIKPIIRASGSALAANDITAGQDVWLVYDSNNWQILNYIGPIATTQTNVFSSFAVAYGTDHGAPNAIVTDLSTAITLTAGTVILVKVAYANTGPTTINANSLGAVAVQENGAALSPAAIVAGEIVALSHDGSVFQKQPKRWPYFGFDAAAPPLRDLPLAIGDQAVITFANINTVGEQGVPLNIATVQGVYEITVVVTGALYPTPTDSLSFQPNNSLYSAGSFKEWFISPNNFGMTTTSPYLNPAPGSGAEADEKYFEIEAFSPITGPDPVNETGPFMHTLTCSTFTADKSIRWRTGIRGGAASGFLQWMDTSRLWSSLGTIYPSGGTGVAIVKRLA